MAAVAVAGVLSQAPGAGAADPIPTKDPAAQVAAARAGVKAFEALVAETTRELQAGTEKLEQTQARSKTARAAADSTRAEADAAVQESGAARTELSRVVLRNFIDPPRSTLSAVLASGKEGLSDAVLAAHDRDVLEGNQRDLLRKADASRVKAATLVVSAEQLEAEAVREEALAAAEERALAAQAAATQVRLAKAFAALERANAAKAAYDAEQARLAELRRQRALAAAARQRAAEAAKRRSTVVYHYIPSDSGGADCSGGSTEGYPNGFLPSSALCSIGGGHRLRADAARAFLAMSKAYGGLCVTDSYRSYAAQVDVYRRKPTLAAIPGNSNHGLGIAIDFCGGIQRFGSAAHVWMENNAGRFGWVHPSWAQQGGSKPEAWHWEFRG
jgi:hypothetical protein